MKLDLSSLKFKNRLYYILFAALILSLLWLLQVIFFKSFYQTMKTNEIVKIGNEIVSLYGTEEFENQVSKYAYHNNILVYFMDESGSVLFAQDSFDMPKNNQFRAMPPEEFQTFKEKLSQSASSSTHFIHGDKGRTFISYGAILKNTAEDAYYLYLSCPLQPMESTIEVLMQQLIIITIITFILSLMIAQIISRKLSAPIINLTQAAKLLAKGDMTVTFNQKGYTEIRELSEALTYATEELSQLEEYRKDFIANISHDLKTPLTIIKFYGEMIHDVSGNDPEKRNAHCDLIIKETDRLSGLVSELLELSRFQAKDTVLQKCDFNISTCLREIVNGLYILSERDGYDFQLNIEENLTVFGDESSMKRVLYNLITNAVNYTGENKKVYVSLKKAGSKIRFEVRDTGKGISEEEQKNIWERYYKSKEVHKRAVVGTGLGLSIVKNVLELHDAQYGIISELGNGSTFWFELGN